MTPCNPRNPLAICPTCARHSPHMPHLAEFRSLTVCIDATVVAKGANCPMHEHKGLPVLWYSREPEAQSA